MGTCRFAPVRENQLKNFLVFRTMRGECLSDGITGGLFKNSHEEREQFHHVNLKETNVECSLRLSHYLRGNFDYTSVIQRTLFA